MIVTITKKDIIESIASERLEVLRPGYWFGDDAVEKNCPRCAVGCVINRIVAEKTMPVDICKIAFKNVSGFAYRPRDEEDETEDEFEERVLENALEVLGFAGTKPMAALSYYFEGVCEIRKREHQEGGRWSEDPDVDEYTDAMIEDARADTIRFVDKHFPETVLIDINGFEPAKDVGGLVG